MTPNLESILMCGGYKLVASESLFDFQYREVERSLKERWFTLPWRPFKKTRTESYKVPKQEVVIDGKNRVIYAHPEVLSKLQQHIKKFAQPIRWRSPWMGECAVKNNRGIFGVDGA